MVEGVAVIDEMRNDEPAVDPAPSRKSESGSEKKSMIRFSLRCSEMSL